MLTATWLLGLTLQSISRRFRSHPAPVATGTLQQQQKQQQQQQQQSQPQQQQAQTVSASSIPKPVSSTDNSKSEVQPTKASTATVQLSQSISGGKMSEAWAQKQVEAFTFNFDQADKDKNGSLSFDEVHQVLKDSGFKGSEQEAKFIFGHLDRDNDQKISKFEFTAAINNLPRVSIKVFVLRKAFKTLDKDGSGFLTRKEIMDATSRDCGLDISAEKISDLLVYLAKEDDDQKVSFEEFLYVFGVEQIGNEMKTMFEKLDVNNNGVLSYMEIVAATKANHELRLSADRIADLLTTWTKAEGVKGGQGDKKIDYNEFVKLWLAQREKRQK